jgi:hypothetical protein
MNNCSLAGSLPGILRVLYRNFLIPSQVYDLHDWIHAGEALRHHVVDGAVLVCAVGGVRNKQTGRAVGELKNRGRDVYYNA